MPRNPDIPKANLEYLQRPGQRKIKIDSKSWFAWLETKAARSFSFTGPYGHFTARKESKQRGTEYWYAYRWLNGKTVKTYLGVSRNLTGPKLNRAAQKLAPPPQQKAATLAA